MRALVYDDTLHLDTHYPTPKRETHQALLKMRCVGICNTDMELVKGYHNFQGVLGHEFVAEVVEGNKSLIGKRVVGEISVTDDNCDMCRRGIPSQCRNRTTIGIWHHQGAFADYMALKQDNLHVIPEAVSDDEAVFIEPIAAGLQVTEAVHISPRDRVIVIGAGKLGMVSAQVLKLIGADLAVVVRREKQAKLLNNWHIPAVSLDELPQNRAQVVVDCTGNESGFAASLDLVEPRGTIVLKSTYQGIPNADLSRVAVEDIRIVGSRCGPFDAAIRLLERNLVDVESMIDARYPIDNAIDAFNHAQQRGILKVLMDF